MEINNNLRKYISKEILPRYVSFDKAHKIDHAEAVIEQSLYLAQFYQVNIDMVYAIAAYHDTGLSKNRKTHHLESGVIIRNDSRLKEWFSPEQIEIMAQAAEDHRASSEHAPRSIYGKIVAEADRLIDSDTIIYRTIQFGFAHYPELTKMAHIQRAYEHLQEKYGEGGYLKLWIPESPNAERLKLFQALIKDAKTILAKLEIAYDKVVSEKDK
jgi:uncharacterized protein